MMVDGHDGGRTRTVDGTCLFVGMEVVGIAIAIVLPIMMGGVARVMRERGGGGEVDGVAVDGVAVDGVAESGVCGVREAVAEAEAKEAVLGALEEELEMVKEEGRHVVVSSYAGEGVVASGVAAEEEGSLGPEVYLGVPFKMILAVRTDVGLGKGEVAGYAAQAAVAGSLAARVTQPDALGSWLHYGQRKIALKVTSEAQLRELEAQAQAAGLPTAVVCTPQPVQGGGGGKKGKGGKKKKKVRVPGTPLVLAIGPALFEDVDPITGHLSLM